MIANANNFNSDGLPPAADQQTPPKAMARVGERTQSLNRPMAAGVAGGYWSGAFIGQGLAGSADGRNPWGWTGIGRPWAGYYATYEWMLLHPKVAQCLADFARMVGQATVRVDADAGTPDSARELIESTFIGPGGLVGPYVTDALWARVFGHRVWECVWTIRDGRQTIGRLKCQPVGTPLLWDVYGNYAGFRPLAWAEPDRAGGPEYLGVYQSLLYTFGGRPEMNPLHGNSLLENIRETSWRGWLEAFHKLRRLIAKVSGKAAILAYVPGVNADGVANDQAAVNAAQAIVDDKVFTMPFDGTVGASTENLDSVIKFLSPDFGDNAGAIGAIVDEMRFHEAGIANGLELSARVGGESLHGSKADAQQHTDTAMQGAEAFHAEVIGALNRPYGPVDNILAQNFGERMRGRVRVVANPLVDEAKAMAKQVVIACASGNKDIQNALMQQAGQELLVQAGLKLPKPFVFETPAPPAVAPPVNPAAVPPPVARAAKIAASDDQTA